MMPEEEIQKALENGEALQGPDAAIYRKIFDALKQEPQVSLSPDFAERVAHQAAVRKRFDREWIWFAMGVFLFFIAAIVAAAMTGFRADFGFLQSFQNFKGLFLLGFIVICLLQWIDKRVLRTTGQSE